MDYRIYGQEDFRTSGWSGGTTTELAVFPENGDYLSRNFIWRLSTATCDREEAVFSKLPDFDRVLMVLEGNVVLAHEEVRVARLSPYEQDRFDGAYKTKSFGKITDYNLMVAKGNEGYLDVLPLTAESQTFTGEIRSKYPNQALTLYLKEGYATITFGGKTVMLAAGNQLVLEADGGEALTFSAMGEGNLIRGQIFYIDNREELGPVEIPREKATFEDFKTCVFLANTQFHGARFVFRKLKDLWFDEALSAAIRKIEAFYLPFFIGFIGFCLILYAGVEGEWSPLPLLGASIAWILFDCLVISPLIYFAAMPKPVKKHIKHVDELTAYEQKVRERELNTNERVDRILKKYKNSGRNLGN